MFLSRVKVSTGQMDQLLEILKADHYQLHQLLWRLFPGQPEAKRDFLFRCDNRDALPVFYLLSKYEPTSIRGVLNVETKPYSPQLQVGDRLTFSLVANPVTQVTVERKPEEKQRQIDCRSEQGLVGKTTYKRVRHDVVMHKKKQLLAQGMNKDELPPTVEIAQVAGEEWLRQRADKLGFSVEAVCADGYQQHRFDKRKIRFSTLEFQGILKVTDPDTFVEYALYKGVGPAKAFGCGLLTVARV